MDDLLNKLAVWILVGASTACSLAPAPKAGMQVPNITTRQIVRERLSAVVVTKEKHISGWIHKKFAIENAPKDADGGSAAPISEDGYFLTADHVLMELPEKNVFIIYANGGRITPSLARVVWRSAKDDLAILHIPKKTPYFYRWSSPDQSIPRGHSVIHGGMSTGSKSAPGKLRTAIPPESLVTRTRTFKMNIPLEPGDSGGPVVDAYGSLVGINSAVEFLVPMETAIFIDSEGVRPNTRKIQEILRKDRITHPNF